LVSKFWGKHQRKTCIFRVWVGGGWAVNFFSSTLRFRAVHIPELKRGKASLRSEKNIPPKRHLGNFEERSEPFLITKIKISIFKWNFFPIEKKNGITIFPNTKKLFNLELIRETVEQDQRTFSAINHSLLVMLFSDFPKHLA
jgi:hypothetical protein